MVMFISRYKMINLVGDGTYGLVYLAYNQESKEKVILSFVILLKKSPGGDKDNETEISQLERSDGSERGGR